MTSLQIPPHTNDIITAYTPDLEKKLLDLLRIGLKSLDMPPFYAQSILGPAYTWAYPRRQYSEFNIINPWRPLRSAHYLRDILVPSLPKAPKSLIRTLLPPILQDTFWRTTEYFQQADPYDNVSSFPSERWFYINGIATNHALAKMNSEYLAQMFHRPMTVIQNATNSLAIDLLTCVFGKGIKTMPNIREKHSMTEPSIKATIAILDALNTPDIKKVVVIAHSQGTIIISNVLKAIKQVLSSQTALGRCDVTDQNGATTNTEKKTLNASLKPADVEPITRALMSTSKDEINTELKTQLTYSIFNFFKDKPKVQCRKLAKFEVYAFANCANTMTYIDEADQYPYIENYANAHDLVARLGILSPENKPEGLVKIDGHAYVNHTPWKSKHSSWGHLLNEHYLFAMDDYLTHRFRGERARNPYPPQPCSKAMDEPRLYSYFHGSNKESDHRGS